MTRNNPIAVTAPSVLGEGRMTLLTPAQVAERLQVSVWWVYDHTTRAHPRIPAVRIGKVLRYDAADIDKWIAEQRAIGLRRAR